MKLSCDKGTDSLDLELPPPTRRTREIQPDAIVDLGEDGKPVGYDLQHASTKRGLILPIILAEQPQIAAE